MKRIITLCDHGYAGVNQACRHLQRNTGLTRHITLTQFDPQGPESTFVLEHIFQEAPPLVLFCGSWSHLYERFAQALPGPLGFWAHSPGGQLGLGEELHSFTRMLADSRLSVRLCSVPGLSVYPGVEFLPNTCSPDTRLSRLSSGPIPNISLFCGPGERGRKNLVNCLLGLGRLPANYLLHLNGLSQVQGYDQLLRELAIPFYDHGWIQPQEMAAWLDKMDLGLQISFSESFGYLVTEHLLRGIPVLASAMVPSMDWLSPRLRKVMQVLRADDPQAIAEQIEQLLADRGRSRNWARQARRQILRANRTSVAEAVAFLQRWVT